MKCEHVWNWDEEQQDSLCLNCDKWQQEMILR